jgi:predicted HTH domain antitoxin
MKNLQIPVPDDIDLILGSDSPEQVTELARLLLAIKLFEIGRLTSGQAAQIAGLSRRRFLLELPRYDVPSVSWDVEEIEVESRSIAKMPMKIGVLERGRYL